YDAGTAVIRASGGGGEFLTMLRVFDSIFLNFIIDAQRDSADGSGSNEVVELGLLLYLPFAGFAAEVASLLNRNSRFEIDYVLRPGSRHVQIRSRMINRSSVSLAIPSALLKNSMFTDRFPGIDFSSMRVPIGMVMLYGKLNNVWIPGAGFDLRHPLEKSFKRN